MTCSGSVFQMRAPATGKAREPMEVSRTAGTIRLSEVKDRSLWREGTSATRTNCRILWYVAGQSMHVTSGRQPCMLCAPAHVTMQCKLTSASVIWSERRSRNIRRAAAFWTDWRRRRRKTGRPTSVLLP